MGACFLPASVKRPDWSSWLLQEAQVPRVWARVLVASHSTRTCHWLLAGPRHCLSFPFAANLGTCPTEPRPLSVLCQVLSCPIQGGGFCGQKQKREPSPARSCFLQANLPCHGNSPTEAWELPRMGVLIAAHNSVLSAPNSHHLPSPRACELFAVSCF